MTMTNTKTKTELMHPAVAWLQNDFLPSIGGNLSEAERQLGISEKTLRGLIRGDYHGNEQRQLAKLEEQRQRIGMAAAMTPQTNGNGGGYIRTKLLERAWNVFDAAKAAHLLNTLEGVSQSGKTTAAQAYRDRFPDTTVLVRLSQKPTISSVVRELKEAMGLPGKFSTVDSAMRALRKAVTPRHLIIVDEAHLALDRQQGADALDVIRELFDRCGCGVTLIFTDFDRARFNASAYAPQLEQLKRRGLCETLPKVPSSGDVRAIFDAYGLPEPDAETQATIGALVRRSCFGELLARIRLALAEASRDNTALNWRQFNASLARLSR